MMSSFQKAVVELPDPIVFLLLDLGNAKVILRKTQKLTFSLDALNNNVGETNFKIDVSLPKHFGHV